MIGLEYVLKLYEMTQQELADGLEIKRQNIDSWIRNQRNIPKKHLPKLTEIFDIPVEYFQKELEPMDKEKIQMMKLYQTSNEEELGYKKIDKIIDDRKWDLGEHESEFEEEMKISLLEYNLEKEELLSNIQEILDLGIGNANYTPSAYVIKISSREVYLRLIESFVDIIKKSDYIERSIISDTLRALETYINFGYKKRDVTDIELSDDSSINLMIKNQVNFSNKLMDLINEYKNILLEQNEQLKEEK